MDSWTVTWWVPVRNELRATGGQVRNDRRCGEQTLRWAWTEIKNLKWVHFFILFQGKCQSEAHYSHSFHDPDTIYWWSVWLILLMWYESVGYAQRFSNRLRFKSWVSWLSRKVLSPFLKKTEKKILILLKDLAALTHF